MTTRAPVLLAILLSAAAASAAEVWTWTGEKGERLALVEDHRVPVVRLVVESPVGILSPWARANHAEEAFEIQLFDPTGELRRRADRLGCELTVTMGPRSARVELSVARGVAREAVALVGDVLRNRSLDHAQLDRWHKERVLSWEGSARNPHTLLAQAGARALFQADDPRRWRWEKPQPVLTDRKRLLAARDLVVGHPDRVVGFAGDLDRSEASALAAILPRAEGPRVATEPRWLTLAPGARRRDLTVEVNRLTQTYFAWFRPSLADTDPRWPAFVIADHVLGGHDLSRLDRALRHTGGRTYSARTVLFGREQVDLYALTCATHSARAAEMERALRQVLEAFHRDGISEDERATAVGYLGGRRRLDLETPGQQLEAVLEELRRGLPRGWRERLVERAATTDLEAVNAFIADFYDPAQFVLITAVNDS